MVPLIDGLIGGFVATVIMTMFMMILGDDTPPPTAQFWSQYVQSGEPSEYLLPGMVLHLIYGVIAGGVFAGTVGLLGFVSTGTLSEAVLWGLGYGFVLFVAAAVFWMNLVLDMDPEPRDVGLFLGFHLVYGGVLGAWLSIGLFS